MPYGESEDLLIQVGNVVFPCDFVILDMVDDPYTPLILGRDALKTLCALINCSSKTITIWVTQENVMLGFAKSSKEPMVEPLCSLEFVESMIEVKVEGRDVLVAPIYDKEVFYDDEMMKKSVVVEKVKEFVLVNNDDEEVEDTIKQARKRKRVRERKSCKKKKMAPPWLGGAPHFSAPPDDPASTLLTSATATRWRVLGHHSRGDGDARSKSTPSSGMVSFFSFHI